MAAAEPILSNCPAREPSPKKIAFADDRDGRFLARLGNDGEPDFAFLNIEDRVGCVPLGEDDLLFRNRQDFSAVSNSGEESVGVELSIFLAQRWETHEL